MKQITYEQAMARIARKEPVRFYDEVKDYMCLPLEVIAERIEAGAFFAVDGEPEVKTFPTVHEPKGKERVEDALTKKAEDSAPKAKTRKAVAAGGEKNQVSLEMKKRKRDYPRMQALRNAGRSVEWIADDCGVSVKTVYAHTVNPEGGRG